MWHTKTIEEQLRLLLFPSLLETNSSIRYQSIASSKSMVSWAQEMSEKLTKRTRGPWASSFPWIDNLSNNEAWNSLMIQNQILKVTLILKIHYLIVDYLCRRVHVANSFTSFSSIKIRTLFSSLIECSEGGEFKKFLLIFYYFTLSSLFSKPLGILFEQNWIPFTGGCFVPSLFDVAIG